MLLPLQGALATLRINPGRCPGLPIPMYIGGAVGLIISIPFGIWNVIKTQRHYQKILDQIEDLRTEGK